MTDGDGRALIDEGFVRLYGTKNPTYHPTADQTATPASQDALRMYRDCRPAYVGPPAEGFANQPNAPAAIALQPFWVGEDGLSCVNGYSTFVCDRLKQAFKHTGYNITPTNCRRLTETVTSAAAIDGVVTSEAAANIRITQQHSGRVAWTHYIKRRRLAAAKSASKTFEKAIAHDDGRAQARRWCCVS